MPGLSRTVRRGGLGSRPGKMDRPSRLLIFARRRRRLVGPALLGMALLTGAGFGLHVLRAMRTSASFAPIRAAIGRAAGLRVTDIVIQGRNMTPESQVLAALGVGAGAPLLGFSVEAARARLDRLSFVEHATVERRLPGTVLVRLTERRPFAVWQRQNHFVLIDRNGEVVEQHGMTSKDADAFAELPLVVGAGAPKAATALIDALADEPEVRRQVVAAVRIGQRRWNLALRTGAAVLLPEGAEIAALHRLEQLQDQVHLLERPLVAIDMRLPDRLVVRPRPQPAAAPPGPAPASSGATAPADGRPDAADPGYARRPA